MAILICIVLLATYKPQAKYNKGMLFAVTLPAHAVDHPDIGLIQRKFNERLLRVSLLMIVLFVPCVLLYKAAAYQTIYFLVWLAAFIYTTITPFRKAFRDTLALKRQQMWFVGEKRVVRTDLRVARLKNERAASPWLFLIPFAFGGGLLLWAAQEDAQLVYTAAGAPVLTVLFWLISLFARKMKAKVYSGNSEVNVSLNQANRRIFSLLWLNVAIVENVHFLLVCLWLRNGNEQMNGIWLSLTLVFAIIPVCMVVYAYRKFAQLEQEVLALDDKIVYTDDDEYWANGFTYHNPNDASVFVTKRIGIGETINTATLAGKLIMWGGGVLMAGVILGVSFMLVRSELISPSLTLTSGQRVEIDYPMYSFDFSISDIEELALVNAIPSGTRVNGEATGQNMRGHFRLKELGKSRLYVVRNNPPYIRIKLPDVYVFYNDEDPELTRQIFDQIQKLTNRRILE